MCKCSCFNWFKKLFGFKNHKCCSQEGNKVETNDVSNQNLEESNDSGSESLMQDEKNESVESAETPEKSEEYSAEIK